MLSFENNYIYYINKKIEFNANNPKHYENVFNLIRCKSVKN